ncbi:4Fe-4S binding protein [Methanobrevibacter sp.]
MVLITIDEDKCEGSSCGECVDICPMEILLIDENKIIITNQDECSICEVCMDVCPEMAIEVIDNE